MASGASLALCRRRRRCRAEAEQAASFRPSQHDGGRTDGGLRAHSSGVAATAAGWPGLGSVGIVLFMHFVFLEGTLFFERCAKPRALQPAMNARQSPFIAQLRACPWAHG